MNVSRAIQIFGEVAASITVVFAIGLIFEYGHLV